MGGARMGARPTFRAVALARHVALDARLEHLAAGGVAVRVTCAESEQRRSGKQ